MIYIPIIILFMIVLWPVADMLNRALKDRITTGQAYGLIVWLIWSSILVYFIIEIVRVELRLL
jgi:hypothetical protein